MSTIADEKVARFILRDFRATYGTGAPTGDAMHLVECPDARAEHIEGADGSYGCDTGCEYATLTARIECPHGTAVDHEYGDFGEIADIIADIDADLA